jgi:hypothetical protein
MFRDMASAIFIWEWLNMWDLPRLPAILAGKMLMNQWILRGSQTHMCFCTDEVLR